ncbi:hypothetical protein HW115_03450 [Verrucomicrobiaceae bacterium N1E253]|uniref:Hydrazine synthase alpha subunit middle domain-containing protein n=1 Tax=Oceaniferula marina TaxID=2748318 RepID=A0A851GFT9_9BACT|nr:hypothetical protein [Oceaniferula marina]NWK54651.1 hypothetical protein [Oceaniferula marina]
MPVATTIPRLFFITILLSVCLQASEPNSEYATLQHALKHQGPKSDGYPRLKKEAFRQESLILASDQSPCDVILRRTQALLNHLRQMKNAPDLDEEQSELDTLALQVNKQASGESDPKLFDQLCHIRRRIALKNPLLDFDQILFLKHHKQGRGEIHMVDQYLGFNQKAGGGVFILDKAFSNTPGVRHFLESSVVKSGRLQGKPLTPGSFISLDLDYDAQRIAFAYTEAHHEHLGPEADWSNQHWSYKECRTKSKNYRQYHFRPESTFHIYSANIDGSDLRALSDGMHNEYDPCFMPDGRIAYISERNGGNQRCGSRALPSGTLHSMCGDGSQQTTLSWHDTNEWQPSIDNHGMIVYTRWDYIDRDSDVAHHLWTCYPDGRDPRSNHGNYPDSRESRPWMEMSIRAIPDSNKFVAVAAPHHGEAYGSLILIDPDITDDRQMSQIKRLTPEVLFPESEKAPGVPHAKGKHRPKGEVYGSPWPLSENFYLCVYDPGQKNHGIYLVDSFGNKELLYRDPSIACLDPIPLKARARPPILPIQTAALSEHQETSKPELGTIAIMNVYDSALPLPKGTTIKELRVVAVFPKWNAFQDRPRIGLADQSLARGVLGTVPVEADGSVYFECPTDIEIYFQLLDESGEAIQSMRSGTYLHQGERMSCIGCHENKHHAPTNRGKRPIAMKRAPSRLVPEAPGSYPLTFPRLVQPVLDQHCVECHNQKSSNTFSLDGATVQKNGKAVPFGWSNGFYHLRKYGWGKHGGNGALIKKNHTSYSIPGKIGAKASRLKTLLDQGHHEVNLTPEERRRLTLWMDCNTNFFGAYRDTRKQAEGGIVMPKVHTIKPTQQAR